MKFLLDGCTSAAAGQEPSECGNALSKSRAGRRGVPTSDRAWQPGHFDSEVVRRDFRSLLEFISRLPDAGTGKRSELSSLRWTNEGRPDYSRQKKYRVKHRQKYCRYQRNYRLRHLEDCVERDCAYRQKNKAKLREYYRVRQAFRLKSDVSFRLLQRLRNRIWDALKGRSKEKSLKCLLGCTLTELISHLEIRFEPGMSWENYGLHGWHIDHIRPCASFDLTDPEQQKACFHYTNLQPLWAKDNLRKGAR